MIPRFPGAADRRLLTASVFSLLAKCMKDRPRDPAGPRKGVPAPSGGPRGSGIAAFTVPGNLQPPWRWAQAEPGCAKFILPAATRHSSANTPQSCDSVRFHQLSSSSAGPLKQSQAPSELAGVTWQPRVAWRVVCFHLFAAVSPEVTWVT